MDQDYVRHILRHSDFLDSPEARLWLSGEGEVAGEFLGCRLSSVFQPVIDLAEGGIHGHEAYVRSGSASRGGIETLSPWNLFCRAADDKRLILLDRICRVLHTLNFHGSAGDAAPGRRLFLNIHGRLMAAVKSDHGAAFRQVVNALALPAQQFVMETPESCETDLDLLSRVLENYRNNGFAVAMNISGRGDTAALLSRLVPDYLKLDARRFDGVAQIRPLVELAARFEVPLIFQRIETPGRLNEVRAAGVSFGQGYQLGRPTAYLAHAVGDATWSHAA